MILIEEVKSYEDWREKSLELFHGRISPDQVSWSADAFFLGEKWQGGKKAAISLPKKFVVDSRIVACDHHAETWSLLYRMLWRMGMGQDRLMDDALDPDVLEFQKRTKAVTRDLHKMKAFVRFRRTLIDDEEWYVAFHSPDYHIMRLAGPFFQERFKGMNWSIFTPSESAHWNGEELTYSPGVDRPPVIVDEQESLWKTYYSSVFNPARIKIKAMKKEMPVRHWKTLPESKLIDQLIDEAPARLKEFYESQLPQRTAVIHSLEDLALNIKQCRNCTICAKATAPVMGIGPKNARLMLVGEQPGDEEDKEGVPFIGPAGKLLDRALDEVQINRREIYITNAVKGFKWLPKEHRRWHRSADGSEIGACRPWLKSEVELVKPEILVCLGRSAAQSVLGKMIKLDDVRGKFFSSSFCEQTIILPHPSSILRCQDEQEKQLAYQRFVSELKLIHSRIA